MLLTGLANESRVRVLELHKAYEPGQDHEHKIARNKHVLLVMSSDYAEEDSPKQQLHGRCQAMGTSPVYFTQREGPDHGPVFRSTVTVLGHSYQGEQAKTKKVAEQKAAERALHELQGDSTLTSSIAAGSKKRKLQGRPHPTLR